MRFRIMLFAPIILFAFNRPEHLKKTIEFLKANKESSESELICYCDGPRDNFDDKSKVEQVRDWLAGLGHFKKVTVINREKNWGLAHSIIDGVTETIKKYGKAIVLEDDMMVSPFFLQYMNEAIDRYCGDSRVCSVHGYCFPVDGKLPETFFLRGADCWGWGTWTSGWSVFNSNGRDLYEQLVRHKMQNEFNFNGGYDYLGMLRDQIEGKNNSWAIRWYASAFLANKLTLYPGVSLVNNFGMDSSGTHCETSDVYTVIVSQRAINLQNIPVEKNQLAFKRFERFFKKKNTVRQSTISAIKAKITSILCKKNF